MRLRDPRYTGENRCWPCTALNVAILASGVVAVAILAAVGAAVLVACLGGVVIALRGYLVPGTPRLTRALPEPVRVRFGGHGAPAGDAAPTDALVAVGVLADDLSLDAEAAAGVLDAARAYLDDRESLADGVVRAFPSVVESSTGRRLDGGENWFAFAADETTVYRWNSRAVAALDVATAELLSTRLPDWSERPPAARSSMLALVRRAVPDCPDCGDAYAESDGPRVACGGGRSLVGDRRCETCGYALVDRNDLPDAEVLA